MSKDRETENARSDEAQLLARLRRRAPSREISEPTETTEPSSDESSKRLEERTETLRRLVSANAPKEPTSSLSSLSSTLRRELGTTGASAFGVNEVGDSSLDLIETELELNESSSASRFSKVDDASLVEKEEPPEAASSSRVNASGTQLSVAQDADSSRDVSSDSEPSSRVDLIMSDPPGANAPSERERSTVDETDVDALLVVSELRKGYVKGKKLIPVLQGVNLTTRKGELLAVVGQSGSGKSTLLHLMGTLDVPDSGTIHFDGQRIDNLPSAQRDVLRNRFIGMIFQFYHLIPEMTTLENALAPLMIRDSIFGFMRNRRRYVEQAKELLDLVGLSHRLRHKPSELSGGEMQRASIARALITNPRVLLADEPTGNLDSKASVGVLNLLRKLNEEKKLTIVMVTHDMSQARDADRAVRIVDGWIVPE